MGVTVPLGEVGRITTGVGDPTIKHSEKIRLVEVTGNIAEGSLTQKRGVIDARIAGLELPAGVFINYGGDAENQDEAFRAILEALILAIVLISIVMAGILESFVHPFTVMVTLPLSLIGMAVAMFFSGETINIMSLMALMMMIGFVVPVVYTMFDRLTPAGRRETKV